ncbi:MAG: hypothetical protein JWP65_304 [Ramlibacter sp.]|jgi:hypothetical protein|uniref:hypothetical protein n=1 Tax=Ramlibacter sp. TaxID=1917967 RepID=UPI002626DF73|nr:hypothetical protein [Ramlibacter sp.]MDB5749883.1 hypothetical protein [Ramlibacter sp.]
MASYFVDERARANGVHPVHDRNRCPPSCFAPERQPQYLGDFIDAAQAMCVARLRYRHAHGCSCCSNQALPPQRGAMPRLPPGLVQQRP